MFRLSEKKPQLGPFTRKNTLHFFLPWSESLQSTRQVLGVVWPSGRARPARETITKGDAFKVNRPLPSIDGLSVGRPSCPRCLSVIAPRPDGLSYSHNGEQGSLPYVCSLLVKIEHWTLRANYTKIPLSRSPCARFLEDLSLGEPLSSQWQEENTITVS